MPDGGGNFYSEHALPVLTQKWSLYSSNVVAIDSLVGFGMAVRFRSCVESVQNSIVRSKGRFASGPRKKEYSAGCYASAIGPVRCYF